MARYTRADSAVSCALGDGAAILDTARNRYFSLNAVGSLIWEALPQSDEEIAGSLVARYAIDHERAISDVRAILSEFEREGLAARDAAA